MAGSRTEEIADHRSIRREISLGGTAGAFLLESSGGPGFAATLYDSRGRPTLVEGLYDRERLFRVKYQNGLEVVYGYGGNLQTLVMNVARFYGDIPVSVFGRLEEEVQAVVELMLENQSDLLLEIDLKDGLALGDMTGWIQIIAQNNLKKTDGGIGGREIRLGQETVSRSVQVNEAGGRPIGIIYLVSGLNGGNLHVGVGDQRTHFLVGFRRLIDPERLRLAKTPVGMRAFLISLME